MWLFCNVVDQKIVKHLIVSGNSGYGGRILNRIMILFKNYENFIGLCLKRYHMLMCCYYRVDNIDGIVQKIINNNTFWSKAIQDFTSKKVIVFDNNHNGNTRKKLYILGKIFGYRHITTGQTVEEKLSNKGHIYYGEYKIDTKKLYTMRELRKLRMNLPDMWLLTDKKNERGEMLYEADKTKCWYKRGIAANTPGILIFTKYN